MKATQLVLSQGRMFPRHLRPPLPVDAVVCRLSGTGLQRECTVSIKTELLWLSGSVTEQQDKTHPARGEPIGAPQEQSAPSRDSAPAAVISQDLIALPNLLRSLFPCF